MILTDYSEVPYWGHSFATADISIQLHGWRRVATDVNDRAGSHPSESFDPSILRSFNPSGSVCPSIHPACMPRLAVSCTYYILEPSFAVHNI